ncbi:hypothetical protein MK904_09620 [Loigolactobacillus coryniformis]|nr:hypothetical protein [Loigolactobacillus coryniformis]MDC4186361.1 hypothetical protein [Loigolactobacillus coryniformis]
MEKSKTFKGKHITATVEFKAKKPTYKTLIIGGAVVVLVVLVWWWLK